MAILILAGAIILTGTNSDSVFPQYPNDALASFGRYASTIYSALFITHAFYKLRMDRKNPLLPSAPDEKSLQKRSTNTEVFSKNNFRFLTDFFKNIHFTIKIEKNTYTTNHYSEKPPNNRANKGFRGKRNKR